MYRLVIGFDCVIYSINMSDYNTWPVMCEGA